MKNKMFIRLVLLAITLVAFSGCQSAPQPAAEQVASPADPIEGAWRPMTYRLESGESHPVDGSIFFSGDRWAVVFYVLDESGHPTRGAAEGGTYTTQDDELTFSHLYNLSSGEAVEGLEASSLRMVLRDEGEGVPEECTYQIEEDRLTIFFPSGNTMEFVRFGD